MKTKGHVLMLCFLVGVAAAGMRFVTYRLSQQTALAPSVSLKGTRVNGVALGDTQEAVTSNLGPGWTAQVGRGNLISWRSQSLDSSVEVSFVAGRAAFVSCMSNTWTIEQDGKIVLKHGDLPSAAPRSIGSFKRVESRGGFLYTDSGSGARLEVWCEGGRIWSAILQTDNPKRQTRISSKGR